MQMLSLMHQQSAPILCIPAQAHELLLVLSRFQS